MLRPEALIRVNELGQFEYGSEPAGLNERREYMEFTT